MVQAMSTPEVWTASNHPDRRRMLDVCRAGFGWADEVHIAVSFLRFSGLGLVLEQLKALENRSGRLKLLTSTYLGITQPEAIRALTTLVPLDDLRVFDAASPGFHMKVFLFGGVAKQECWVGSSNFTKGGLSSNFELNLCHREPAAIAAVHRDFQLAWEHPASRIPDAAFLADYEARSSALARNEPDPNPSPTGADYPWRVDDSYGQASLARPTRMPPSPNEAQREALVRLSELRDRGERRAVIIAAPGIGKTYLAAFDAQAAGAKRILFVSHRLEHLRQAMRTFLSVIPKLSAGLVDGNHDYDGAAMTFASIQSVRNQPRILARAWDYVVIDEFHHAESEGYRSFIEGSSTHFLLGLTATPERQDGHDVLRLCDYNVAWEVRLPEAIRRAWLVPFHYFGIADDLVDYASIPWRSGRFEPSAVENALLVEERVDLALRHALEKGFDGRRRATVGFCAGRRHAAFMAEAFRRRGLHAIDITGDVPVDRREKLYRDFADPVHPLEWVFVADVLNEGVDIPAINSILFLRPTDSATVFLQQLGRGLRLHPGCEVLTVVDLVGHHRKAWLSLSALADQDALPGPSTVPGLSLTITPPPGCEIVLEQRTLEILAKVDAHGRKRRDRCVETYQRMREELGAPPYPVDFIGRSEDIELEDFRAVFESWIGCREEMGDAEPWELELAGDHPLRVLLGHCERNWQAPRVTPYALLWGAVARRHDLAAGYAAFFERFPRWRSEATSLEGSSTDSLAKKLGGLWKEGGLDERVFEPVPEGRILQEVERRVQLILERDFRARHGGVLRRPEDLVRWKRYPRPEIINHFGRQYDPARHNTGVITFAGPFARHIVLITKLDTSTAQSQFHYRNAFSDPETFMWQSQNRNTPEDEPGRRLVTPGLADIHLFVQERSHTSAVYCGLVDPLRFASERPIDIWFRLRHPVPEQVRDTLAILPPS